MATKIHAREIMSISLAAVPFGMSETCKKYVKKQIIDKNWYTAFYQLPFLLEWWLFGPMDGLSWLWRKWSPNYEVDKEYFQSFRNSLSQPGIA